MSLLSPDTSPNVRDQIVNCAVLTVWPGAFVLLQKYTDLTTNKKLGNEGHAR